MTGQVLVKLVLQGLEAVTIGGAGAEARDVKAWGVWQVDGEGLGQHQELIFLQGWEADGPSGPGGKITALGVGEQARSIAPHSQGKGQRADDFEFYAKVEFLTVLPNGALAVLKRSELPGPGGIQIEEAASTPSPVHPAPRCGPPCSSRTPQIGGRSGDSHEAPLRRAHSQLPTAHGMGSEPPASGHSLWAHDPGATRGTCGAGDGREPS